MYKSWTLEDIIIVLKDLDKKYNTKASEVETVISSRMTKCKGQYKFKIDSNKNKVIPIKFTFAKNLLGGYYPEDVVKEVIIHEYAHYVTQDNKMRNQGHNSVFKANCRKLGISDSTYFEYDELNSVAFKEDNYKYKVICSKCKKIIEKRKTIKGNKLHNYISNCCHADLIIEEV